MPRMTADRRQHNRNVKVMRVARLKDVKLHAECLGLVRDVSPGGMMIDADFPLEIGQTSRRLPCWTIRN